MSSFDTIPPQLWMIVPREERQVLVEVFDIPKTGISEIHDQEVISDGYNKDDLAHITAEKMAEFVGSEESFPRLWELSVAKARAIVNPPVGKLTSKNGGLVINDVDAEEQLQEYEKTDVILEKVGDATSEEFAASEGAPTPNVKKNAKRNTKKD